MRKPIIAGNWKMNKTPQEAAELIAELKTLVKDAASQVVVCVPAVDIPAAVQAVRGSKIKVGAQNVHFKESGAYTGELSAQMLKACKVDYVIIGHSERRQYFGETDETVNLRTLAAVKAGLIPIVCVGEKKEQREAGYTDDLVTYQTLTALTGLTSFGQRRVLSHGQFTVTPGAAWTTASATKAKALAQCAARSNGVKRSMRRAAGPSGCSRPRGPLKK